MMNDEKRNKALKPKVNKVLEPAENKSDGVVSSVWIRINHNRAIAGLGVAGDEVQVSQLVAMNFVAQGLATIIEKEINDG